jgi:hypothetical protein
MPTKMKWFACVVQNRGSQLFDTDLNQEVFKPALTIDSSEIHLNFIELAIPYGLAAGVGAGRAKQIY